MGLKVDKFLTDELKRQKSIYENLKWQLAERDKKVRFLSECLHDFNQNSIHKSLPNPEKIDCSNAYFHREMK